MTASPISFTSLTDGSSASPARCESRPATLPSSSTGSCSPSSVKPTRSAKATTACWVSSSRPERRCSCVRASERRHLLQMQGEDVLEPRTGQRHQLLGDHAVAVGELVLVQAGLQEGARDQRAGGFGVARHSLPEHAGDFERVLVGEPGLPVRGAEPRGLEVLLAVHALVVAGRRQAERAPAGGEHVQLDRSALGDLARRVAGLGAQRAGDRREHELVLGHDAAQLLHVHPLLVQLVQQPPSRVARAVVLEAL